MAVISTPISRSTDTATRLIGEILAAVGTQLGDALVADDDADHHRHQPDDRQRVDARFGDMARDRGQPQADAGESPRGRWRSPARPTKVDDRRACHATRVVGPLAQLDDELPPTGTRCAASAAARGRGSQIRSSSARCCVGTPLNSTPWSRSPHKNSAPGVSRLARSRRSRTWAVRFSATAPAIAPLAQACGCRARPRASADRHDRRRQP